MGAASQFVERYPGGVSFQTYFFGGAASRPSSAYARLNTIATSLIPIDAFETANAGGDGGRAAFPPLATLFQAFQEHGVLPSRAGSQAIELGSVAALGDSGVSVTEGGGVLASRRRPRVSNARSWATSTAASKATAAATRLRRPQTLRARPNALGRGGAERAGAGALA